MKNKPNIFFNFRKWWLKLIRSGISDEISFEEKKITLIFNIFTVTGIPASFFFVVLNALQHRLLLSIINLTCTLGAMAILVINKKRKYLVARMIFTIMVIILFSVSALLYNNGCEYFLLLNIIATVVLFKNRKWLISVSVASALSFVLIQYLHAQGFHYDNVPPSRIYYNMGWSLAFMIIALYNYKTAQLNYQKIIESSNFRLQRQQVQLLQQKEDLQNKSSALEILNQTKEKLFSVIAHDMRSPIAALKSSLDLYNSDLFTETEFKEITSKLHTEVDHLFYNLDNLLHWSHSQLNGMKVKPSFFQLKPVVSQTISLLMEGARQKQVEITEQIGDDVRVFADPDQVKVVIRNLLSNAIKFSHPEDIVMLEAFTMNGATEVFVKDVGVGMSEQQVSNLFKQSKIQSHRGTQNEKGTGLGLVLCKEFIEKNNGTLRVHSIEGEGTTFSFTLPSKPK